MALWDNLTHYWPLDEASGARADVVGTADLTATTLGTTGISGGGELADDIAQSLTSVEDVVTSGQVASLVVWFQFTGSATAFLMITKHASGLTGFSLNVINKRLQLVTANIVRLTTGILTEGVWHLAVATISSTKFTLSVDGAAPQDYLPGGLVPFSSTLSACYYDWVNGGEFVIVDEMAIFDRVLSSSDAASLWNSGSGSFYAATTPPPAVATWTVPALAQPGLVTPPAASATWTVPALSQTELIAAPVASATWTVPALELAGRFELSAAVATWTVTTANPLGLITPAPAIATWTVSPPAFTGPLPQPAAAATWTMPPLSQAGPIPDVVKFGSVTLKSSTISTVLVQQ